MRCSGDEPLWGITARAALPVPPLVIYLLERISATAFSDQPNGDTWGEKNNGLIGA